MGYRSSVAYTIRFKVTPTNLVNEYGQDLVVDVAEEKKCKESFYTFLTEAKSKEETRYCFSDSNHYSTRDEHNQGLHIDEEKLQINFLVYGVKWYPDYDDVKCHTALVYLAQEWGVNDEYIGGVFVSIGEELDDNEEFTFGNGQCEWLTIIRSIEFDWSSKKVI